MRKFLLVCALFMTIILFSCSRQKITEEDKIQAKEYINNSMPITNNWLTEFDTIGYDSVLKIKRIENYKLTNEQMQKKVKEQEEAYGRVKERRLLGIHVWTGDKLLSWAQNIEQKYLDRIHQTKSDDDFYNVDPKYFGLWRSSDMVRGYPKGKYAIFMYQSSPSIKPYAEEKLTLWLNSENKWEVVNYTIADNI